jgi:hypothetical protein
VAVDDLDHPLGILELHVLLLVTLMGNLLLAFELARRCAAAAWLLLLLLMELLHELLDLLTLLGVVAPGVVHQAPWPALVTTGELAQSLVIVWAMAPTYGCSNNSGSGSTCQQLVVVGLLLPILVFPTALSSGICFGLTGLPCLWSRLGVPCTPFCSPGAPVRQGEELTYVFHIICGQLLEYLLFSHTLSKSNYNRAIGDVGVVFQT